MLKNKNFQINCESFRQSLKNQKGFSLMEILIAISLLAIVGTIVTGALIDRLRDGERNSTISQIVALKGILKDYNIKCGAYPTTEQGLEALISPPTGGKECKRYPPNGFIEDGKLPKDAWQGDFIYESDGRKFTIISLGADNMEGGEGADADINSHELDDAKK